MSSFNNGLGLDEAERLAVLLEELGEVQQVIGKILRHGYNSVNPLLPDGEQVSNRGLLQREIGDLEFAISLMKSRGDVDSDDVAYFKNRKSHRIWRWLHHNREKKT